ncbi:DNA internalization-related competence protein ComEC/Rec2 [Pseudoflavonifractor sp. 60]|nr:DNA internalization-related competence protein ComEC/Rec2 [Pseudoflavonifractor sp. 60]
MVTLKKSGKRVGQLRILATFAFSFAAAVFCAVYGQLDAFLLPLGGGLALAAAVLGILLRKKGHRRTRVLLMLFGLAAGFMWTAVYMVIFFRPAQALDNRTVRLRATVSDWPQEGSYGGCTVLVRAETEGGVTLSAILYTDQQGADLRPGDQIETIAHCTLGDRTFAGEKITYYTAKGIFLRATAYGRLEVERPKRIPPRCYAAWAARALKRGIDAAFPEDVSGFVKALVTGNRDSLTDEFTTSLERTGLSHTVAVSGMHLAYLSGVLTRLLGRGKRSTAVLTILWAALFCGIAGNTPSVLRAAVMIVMLQLAPLLCRERDGPTALALALLLLLAANPFAAAHVGLQLSFAAVAGILLVSDRIQDGLLRRFHMDRLGKPKSWRQRLLRAGPRFAVSNLSATLGASVLTVPLVALHFNMVSLIAPLSNLLTLWAIGYLFLGGMAVGVLANLWLAGAAVLAIPFTALARYLQWVVALLAGSDLAALSLNSIYCRAWLVLVYALLLVSVRMKGRRPVWMPVAAGAVALGAAIALTRAAFFWGDLGVTVLDVGQGQSVLVRTGVFLTLVDCGGDSREGPGKTTADYLQSLGLGGIDLLVVSHYHADHANGIGQLLERISVREIALPDVEADSPLRAEILAAAQAREIPVSFIRGERTVDSGEDCQITLLPPVLEEGTANELGLTVLAAAGEADVLITGDMEAEGEHRLVQRADLPDIEVLVAGHHGSATSSTRELLERVKPEFALISVGAGNRYGHPDGEALLRLDEAGAKIYRTDLYGTIEVKLKG